MRLSLNIVALSLSISFTGALAQPPPSSPAEAIRALKANRRESFSAIESGLGKATTEKERARIWTLLAFAPSGTTVVAPHLYAAKAFSADQSASTSIRVRLAKLAGVGFFERAEFSRAQAIFEAALTLEGVPERDREYLEYQAGWCEINRGVPQAATARFRRLLESCAECRLRKEISSDLGRAIAESGAEVRSVPKLRDAEGEAFVRGYIAGSERQTKFRIGDGSRAFAASEMLPLWIEIALSHPRFASASACEKVDVLPLARPDLWPPTPARAALSACVFENPTDRRLPTAFRALIAKTDEDLAWFSEALDRRGEFDEACAIRLDISARQINDDGSLGRAAQSCAKAKVRASMAAKAAALFGALGAESVTAAANGTAPGVSLFASTINSDPTWRSVIEKDGGPAWAKQPSSAAALLLVRANVGRDIAYESAKRSTDWATLGTSMQSDLLRSFLSSFGLARFAADWSVWTARVAGNATLEGILIDAAAANGSSKDAFEAGAMNADAFGRLLVQLRTIAAKGCTEAPIGESEIAATASSERRLDLKRIASTCRIPSLTTGLADSETERRLLEGATVAVTAASTAFRDSSSAPWSSRELSELNRRSMKSGLRALGSELSRRKEARAVSALVKKLERKL